jgi:hypothetical protein
MIRDLVGSDPEVFKSRQFRATMNKEIGIGITRIQMDIGKMSVGWIVLVQNRENPPILVCDHNIVLAVSEIVDRKRR